MMWVVRTTVSIPDELLAAAKGRAAERGISVDEVIEGALRRELAIEQRAVPVFDGGSGPRPGVDLSSNRALHELGDEGIDLDTRR